MATSRLDEIMAAPAIGAAEPLARPELVLEVKALVKEFPGTRALAGVDLDVRKGGFSPRNRFSRTESCGTRLEC